MLIRFTTVREIYKLGAKADKNPTEKRSYISRNMNSLALNNDNRSIDIAGLNETIIECSLEK